jgi:NOL1/NOP2/sun family putative RNA methylase
MISLPLDYLQQMKRWLGHEYDAFMQTYQQPPTRSLRVNTLKVQPDELYRRVPFLPKPVPWCEEGYYYQHEKERPGKHVYHAAGLYYIQDASAMSAVEALEPQPGEKILDLCAAPGGKTTQIAAKMKGKGLCVANEIDSVRIKALVENLERCGVTHAVVLNENPTRLTSHFVHFFDRILIDAPCSGEGMFRKDHDVSKHWSRRAVEKCAVLQLTMLAAAALMLRPGGRLVYATCTFNPIENEGTIQRFLELYPHFSLISVPQANYYQPGRTDWLEHPRADLQKTARLWPHHLDGEGHFVAVLLKGEETEKGKQRPEKWAPIHEEKKRELQRFVQDTYREDPFVGKLTLFGEHLYLLPDELPTLQGIKVERPGRYLGQMKKGRFVPAHALALSSQPATVQRQVNFAKADPDLHRYLQGEVLSTQLDKGWTLVTVDSFPLGWTKAAGGSLKNHYPKWLRWTTDADVESTFVNS